jgi:hypothetical protein
MEFFDNNGEAVCYVTETGRIYSWAGAPIGTLKDGKVHNCRGTFLGWIKEGYFVDSQGCCCLFTKGANTRRGPYPPNRRPRPPKGDKQPFPASSDRQPAPSFPEIQPSWGPSPFKPSLLMWLGGLAEAWLGSGRRTVGNKGRSGLKRGDPVAD